jgi:hypothetical protein
LDGLTAGGAEIKARGVGSSGNIRKLVYHLKNYRNCKISRVVSEQVNMENVSY